MVNHSDADPCESCGTEDVRTTRNNLPEGTSLVLCYPCLRRVREWWRAWANYAQPEQAERLAREARRDERRRERQATEGVL